MADLVRRPDVLPPEQSTPLPTPDRNPAVVFVASYTSADSRRAMRSSLDILARKVAGSPDADAVTVPWQDLRHQHVVALRDWLAGTYAPASANRHLAALRGVLRECWRLGYFDRDTMERAIDVRAVSGKGRAAGRMLAPGEVASLFVAADRHPAPRSLRDRALLALAVGCGLRRSELAALLAERYDAKDGAIIVTGKGEKTRTAWLGERAKGHLDRWLAARGDQPGPLLNPVLGSRIQPSRSLDPRHVYRLLDDLGAAAGLRRFGAHDFRRTWISTLLDRGVDVVLVARMAGHESVKTTQKYDRRPEAAAREAARQHDFTDIPEAIPAPDTAPEGANEAAHGEESHPRRDPREEGGEAREDHPREEGGEEARPSVPRPR